MASTRMRIKRLLFAWLAVTSALFVAACGKTSERSLPAPAAQTTPPAPAEQKDDSKVGDKKEAGGELNEDGPGSGTSSQERGEGDSRGGEVVLDPRGKTPKEIFAASELLGPTRPGLQFADGLFYSGSGQDFLREKLIELVNSETDKAQRERNARFSREIGLTTFEIIKAQPKVSITLIRKNGARLELPNVNLKMIDRRRFKGFEKTRAITVDAACMDIAEASAPGCSTVHLRLERKEKNGTAVAHVLARLTPAYFYVQGNPPGNGNSEYDALIGMFLKSVYRPGAQGTIQSLAFYSTEVIGGVSEFAVMMTASMRDARTRQMKNQLLGWHGPLVKPRRSVDLKLPVQAPDVTREVNGRKVKVPFLDVGSTALVRNDGRGNLQFDIAVGRRKSEVIRLTIARIHSPTQTSPVLR